jgi:PII-like signaling protein
VVKIEGEGLLLRIFIGESDRWRGQPLADAIVLKLRSEGYAGATVLRGTAGFGAHSRIHTASVLRLSEDLPLVIEIVDRPERIEALLPVLDEMIGEGLITLEKVRIIAYRHGAGREPSAPAG